MEDEIEGVEEVLPDVDAWAFQRQKDDADDGSHRRKDVHRQHHQKLEVLAAQAIEEAAGRDVLLAFGGQAVDERKKRQEEGADFKTGAKHRLPFS